MNLRVEALTKRYGRGAAAVRAATFAAAEGGVTTLLGPSGSGKTTILRAIAGLEPIDEGRVLFDERDVTVLPPRERGIGFVFQSFALFPHMTVGRNVAYGLEVRGVPKAAREERVAELLALVQLEGLGERFPAQLSGGQRQRVGFARALACRPALLLLDEPFGALDTRVRLELREWLTRLHETTRLTTILVTHDQEEALELSARIVVMDQGRVVQVGTPAEIYDEPRTPFVASFVGSANVLRGRVSGDRASIGALSMEVPSGSPEGAAVQAVVRPHHVGVGRDGAARPGRTTGRIMRRIGLGASVKLQLLLASSDSITVELPRREADALHLAVGDEIFVDLGEPRVFVGDWEI